jgi:hypothetical protein
MKLFFTGAVSKSNSCAMRKIVSIDELRAHMNCAQEILAHEKESIHRAYTLTEPCLRPEYALAYVRAESHGMQAINKRLAELSWLPLQLDPGAEVMGPQRASLKRWMKTAPGRQPDAMAFGNDFIHALTRAALCCGWTSGNYLQLAARVADLFHDVACLVAAAYYCNELVKAKVESVALRAPEKLRPTVEDLAMLADLPALFKKYCTLANEEKTDGAKFPGGHPPLHVIDGGVVTPEPRPGY